MTLRVLSRRFGPLDKAYEPRVRQAGQEELEAIVDRALTAESVERALGAS